MNFVEQYPCIYRRAASDQRAVYVVLLYYDTIYSEYTVLQDWTILDTCGDNTVTGARTITPLYAV